MAPRVFITGVSGFIGTNLAAHLLSQGWEVRGVDIAPLRDPSLAPIYRNVDIRARAAVDGALASFAPDVVMHLAARTDLDGTSLDDYSSNIVGVENVISATLAHAPAARFIAASSMLVFEPGVAPRGSWDYRPKTLYGHSKVEGEEILRKVSTDALEWVIVRPTSIWGPWFRAPYREFFNAVKARRYVHPGHDRAKKSFGYVGNAVVQLQAMAEAPADRVVGRPFWLTDYDPIVLEDWANEVSDAWGVRRPARAPLWLLRMAATAGSAATALGLPAPLTRFRLSNLLANDYQDSSSTRELVPELPYSLRQGTIETVAWLREQG